MTHVHIYRLNDLRFDLFIKIRSKSKGRSPNPPINTDELETTNRDLHHH